MINIVEEHFYLNGKQKDLIPELGLVIYMFRKNRIINSQDLLHLVFAAERLIKSEEGEKNEESND